MLGFYMFFFLLHRADSLLLYTEPGQNVTLPCFFAPTTPQLCWYKQVAGEQPKIVSSFYQGSSNRFHGRFEDKRFSVLAGKGFYHLNISNVQDSDSAMYYCGRVSTDVTEFNEGVFLVLKESGHRSYILQPEYESVESGGSVTLKCSVHTGRCDGEHRVYWFKKDSGTPSHAGIMLTQANSSGQCGPSPRPGPPEQRCDYSLPKRDVSGSDAGTYHCAVAHCGDIVLGDGTRLHVRTGTEVLMYCVVAALSFSAVLNIILICICCKTSRKKHSEGLQPQSSIQDSTPYSQQSTDVDALQYVALDFKKRHNKRGQRGTEEETIYSGVRQT